MFAFNLYSIFSPPCAYVYFSIFAVRNDISDRDGGRLRRTDDDSTILDNQDASSVTSHDQGE